MNNFIKKTNKFTLLFLYFDYILLLSNIQFPGTGFEAELKTLKNTLIFSGS